MLVMAALSLIRIFLAYKLNRPIPPAEGQFPHDLDDDVGFTQVGRVNLKHLASILLPCVLLVVAIEYIGYELASFAFLMIIQFFIGSRRWIQSIVIAVSLVAVLYIVMRYGFGVPVPGPQFLQQFV